MPERTDAVWTTVTGERIKVVEMSMTHLLNAYAMLLRNRPDHRFVDIFANEIVWRGLPTTNNSLKLIVNLRPPGRRFYDLETSDAV